LKGVFGLELSLKKALGTPFWDSMGKAHNFNSENHLAVVQKNPLQGARFYKKSTGSIILKHDSHADEK